MTETQENDLITADENSQQVQPPPNVGAASYKPKVVYHGPKSAGHVAYYEPPPASIFSVRGASSSLFACHASQPVPCLAAECTRSHSIECTSF